ncbi:AP3-complex subunit beta-A-like [Macadamia integrifolia]|uniref:AP3-complex subunit beta-A-like n=1 Tax=Macadamia integrifolia TaxID=60698 RepID=UPI001C4E6FA6|nr:AP3-complex subunit beta-A-like [Macadamia integrifolia]
MSAGSSPEGFSDPNPLVQAWALQPMAGIRLHVISAVVLLAVCKGARNPSVYARKCPANAIPKLYDLHQEENAPALEEFSLLLISSIQRQTTSQPYPNSNIFHPPLE